MPITIIFQFKDESEKNQYCSIYQELRIGLEDLLDAFGLQVDFISPHPSVFRNYFINRVNSVNDAAEKLKTSPKTIYRLIDIGKLTAFKVKGSLKIPDWSLDSYILAEIEEFQIENGEAEF